MPGTENDRPSRCTLYEVRACNRAAIGYVLRSWPLGHEAETWAGRAEDYTELGPMPRRHQMRARALPKSLLMPALRSLLRPPALHTGG